MYHTTWRNLALTGLTVWLLAAGFPLLNTALHGEPISVSLLLPLATAQAEEPARVRRTPAMRQQIYQRFSRVRELSDAGKMDEAKSSLASLGKQSLNSYERAMMWNLSAFLAYQEKDYAAAAKAYEELLKQPDLPLSLELETWYSLAKLNAVLENYAGAVKALDKWFSINEKPGPDAYVLKAQLLFQQERYKDVLASLDTALKIHQQEGSVGSESLYLLQRGAYYQFENYQGLKNALEALVSHYPKGEYLVQLAAVYGQLDMQREQTAIKLAAYEKGYLDTESALVNLAQLLMAEGNAYKAAVLLDKEIQAERVKASERHLRLLGDSWYVAKEYDRALAAFARAAEGSDSGDMDLRIAQIHADSGRWDDVIQSANRSIKKGNFDRLGAAHVIKGMALYNSKRLPEALSAFERARQFEQTRNMAEQWHRYVQNEMEKESLLKTSSAALAAPAQG